jgi:hypothetical protein
VQIVEDRGRSLFPPRFIRRDLVPALLELFVLLFDLITQRGGRGFSLTFCCAEGGDERLVGAVESGMFLLKKGGVVLDVFILFYCPGEGGLRGRT